MLPFGTTAVTYIIQNLANQTQSNMLKRSTKQKLVLPDFRPEGWCLPKLSFDGTDNYQIKMINAYLSSLAPAQVTP